MKKNLTSAMVMMMAMLMTMFTFTSCEYDEDEVIADYLTYGNWEGNLDTYYSNRWGEYVKDGEYRTVWRFIPEGYDRYGYATWGYGDEVDYSTRNRRGDYAYCSFRWEVRNGNIYIEYDDPDWNDVRIDWRDYSISRSHFHGTMYDWDDRAYTFDLDNTSWDWDYYDRYWARTRAAGSTDTADDDVYVSDNGKCIATGIFAKAIQNMKKASN